jgi:hypothetical protein
MLNNIDRVQIVIEDRAATAKQWETVLEAQVRREDRVAVLGAHRTSLNVGTAVVELLSPDGDGPIADFLRESGRGGLYAVGFATADVADERERLRARGVTGKPEGGQLFLDDSVVPGGGLRVVISQIANRKRVGVMTRLHEVSFLTRDPKSSSQSLAATFGLDESTFGPAESDAFGFAGVHAYLTADKHDDVETITPVDADKAMGRFFARRGPSLYMAFGESDDMERVRSLVMEHAPEDWTGPREGPAAASSIFVHPKALGGVMLGVRPATT